jgi:hypothetical protein
MNKRRLLIVATRGHAPKNKMPDDEYCAQWGMDPSADPEFKWCCTEKVALLLLHGYKDIFLKDAIAAEAENILKDCPNNADFENPVLFYHHSVQEVGLPQFEKDEIHKPADIAARLKAGTDEISKYLSTQLSTQLRQSLSKLPDEETLRAQLHSEINRIIGNGPLYDAMRFTDIELREKVRGRLKEKLEGERLKCLNRWLLEDAYRDDFQAPSEVELICRQIDVCFPGKKVNSRPYQSGGGLAIEELIRDIRENQPKEYRKDLIEAIERAAAGRTIFVGKLRNIQSALIRLRLFVEIARTYPDAGNKQNMIRQIQDALGLFKAAAGEGSKGKFKEWLEWIKEPGTGAEREKKAVAILSFPGGRGNPDNLFAAAETWKNLTSAQNFLVHVGRNSAGVVADIRLFARALDILMEASEHFPHTLLDSGGDKKKESP